MDDPEGPKIATVGALIDALSRYPRDKPIGVSDADEISVEFAGIDSTEFRADGTVHIIIDHTDG